MKMGTWDTMSGFESRDVILDGFVSICYVALRIHPRHSLLGGWECPRLGMSQ